MVIYYHIYEVVWHHGGSGIYLKPGSPGYHRSPDYSRETNHYLENHSTAYVCMQEGL